MFYILLSVIGGAFVTLSMIINGNLGERIGGLKGTLINYITGLAFAVVLFLAAKLTGNALSIDKINIAGIPAYAFFGGMLGVCVIVLSNKVIPKIPAIYSMVLMFVGQLIMGMVIDYFSFNKFSIGKLIGSIFIILGLLYNFNVDKKTSKKVAEN
ncbi:DMT family transporter [Clostridium sp. C8-1-8]|uniref:DMT family transporter n=1 Tax=Clostridium sp. C8-1-8 TaxID=2698831 RepID=UPI00136D68AE|nr:DMT family transporter [Clostridium sp. C8-1-8]